MSVIVEFTNGDTKTFKEAIYWAFSGATLSVYERSGGKKLAEFPGNTVQSVGREDLMPEKNPLFINFVLDETGSMHSVKDATIEGFNEYVETLKRRPANEVESLRFTLTKFNSGRTNIVHNSVPLSQVGKLNQNNYRPSHNTPLYDAVALTIKSMEEAAKDSNVLCVIQTDGQENDSREWSRDKIFNLITEKKKEGWTFVFLGAGQDAWRAGGMMGIPKLNTVSYDHSPRGTSRVFAATAHGSSSYTASGGVPTSDFFEGNIDIREDTEEGKKTSA